jgi:exonuclease SbcC
MSGQMYRVIRKRNISGKGKVQLQMPDASGEFKDVATGKAADLEIIKILGRTYKTLTSSSILIQGQGERFITSGPTDRYNVVFDILGIEKWAGYRELATKHKNRVEGQAAAVSERVLNLKRDAELISGFKAEEDAVSRELDELFQKMALVDEEEERQTEALAQFKGKQTELERLLLASGKLSLRREELQREIDTVLNFPKESADAEQTITDLMTKWTEEALNRMVAELRVELATVAVSEKKVEALESRIRELADRKLKLTVQLKANNLLLERSDAILNASNSEQQARILAAGRNAELVALQQKQQELAVQREQFGALDKQAGELSTAIAKKQSERDNQSWQIKNLVKTAETDLSAAIAKKQSEHDSHVWQIGNLLKTAETDLSTAIAKKQSEHDNQIWQIKNLLKAAIDSSAILEKAFCKGVGEYAQCPLIEKAAKDKRDIPVLEGRLKEAETPLDLPEKRALDLILSNKETPNLSELVKVFSETESNVKDLPQIQKVMEEGSRLDDAMSVVHTAIVTGRTARSLISANKDNPDLGGLLTLLGEAQAEVKDLPQIQKVVADGSRLDDALRAVHTEIAALEQKKFGIDEAIENLKLKVGSGLSGLVQMIDKAQSQILAKQKEKVSAEKVAEDSATLARELPLLQRAQEEGTQLDAAIMAIDSEMVATEQEKIQMSAPDTRKRELEQSCRCMEVSVSRLQLTRSVEDKNGRLKEIDAEVADLQKSVDILSSDLKGRGTIEEGLNRQKKAAGDLKASVDKKVEMLTALKIKIAGCSEAAKQAESEEKVLAGLDELAKTLSWLETCYEKIPFHILDNVVPIIQQAANDVLAQLSTAGMRVELKTDKANKSNSNVKDVLDIIVSDVAGSRPIEAYSGGEKTRLVLALIVGLAELSARRAGVKIETILIDEPAWLDKAGLHEFALLFQELVASGVFPYGFLMIHDEDVKKMFDQRIEVHREGDKSYVEVAA